MIEPLRPTQDDGLTRRQDDGRRRTTGRKTQDPDGHRRLSPVKRQEARLLVVSSSRRLVVLLRRRSWRRYRNSSSIVTTDCTMALLAFLPRQFLRLGTDEFLQNPQPGSGQVQTGMAKEAEGRGDGAKASSKTGRKAHGGRRVEVRIQHGAPRGGVATEVLQVILHRKREKRQAMVERRRKGARFVRCILDQDADR